MRTLQEIILDHLFTIDENWISPSLLKKLKRQIIKNVLHGHFLVLDEEIPKVQDFITKFVKGGN